MNAALANHLLQSTIFAAVAGMLTLLLRNNHARTRYWVWLTASMKFLVPFSLFVEIGHRLSWSAAPVVMQPRLALVVDAVGQPFTVPETFVVAPAGAASARSIVPMLLVGVWICGCAAVLIFWFVRWLRVAAVVQAGTLIRDGREFDALRRCGGNVKLISSASRVEPGVFGILAPVMSLPMGITNHLNDQQLDAILAHELCHVRHRDNLTAAIHMLVEAVFWFHPFVWFIGARLVEERERACDAEVVRLGMDPEAYAEGILTVCKLYLESPLVCAAGISGSNLGKRIEAIMKSPFQKNITLCMKLTLAGIGILAVGAPLSLGIVKDSARRALAQVQVPHVWVDRGYGVPVLRGQQHQLLVQVGAARPRLPATTTPELEFESASLTPAAPYAGFAIRRGGPGSEDPQHITLTDHTLRDLLEVAYGLRQLSDQIDGPEWIGDYTNMRRYTMTATLPSNTSMADFQAMLRNLLAARFRLVLHHDTRSFPEYELVVASGGPKMKPYKVEDHVNDSPVSPGQKDPDGYPLLGPQTLGSWSGPQAGEWGWTRGRSRESMAQLAAVLGMWVRQSSGGVARLPQVTDNTGLTGVYEITLGFVGAPVLAPGYARYRAPNVPGASTPPPPSERPDGPDIFVALKEQLGLELRKTPDALVDVIVVDNAEEARLIN